MAIPTAALLVVASFSVVATLHSAQTLRSGTDLAHLDRSAIAVAHELDLERDLLSGSIAANRQPKPSEQSALDAQRGSVDRAISAYLTSLASRGRPASPQLAGQLATTRAELAGLERLRATAASGTLSSQAVTGEYTRIITALLGIDLQAALRGGDDRLTQDVRVLTDLTQAKELTAQVRGALLAITTQDRFGFGQFQDFADLLARQQAALDQFQADATNPQRALLANTVKGPAVLAVARIQQAAVNRQARPTLDLDPQQWLEAATTKIELLRGVQTQLLDAVIADSQTLASGAQRRAVTNSLLIVIVLAVALLSALTVAQSMLGPLRRLRASALDVAHRRLPAAVERLQTTKTGEPDVRIRPIGDDAADEMGQLARAFDTVHLAAIRQASGQAALRMSISGMFLNLARRSQRLIDRQLEELDTLEQDADPDLLEGLFRLDHLAVRMRRNAEGLIVLSGTSESPRQWNQRAPLVDVVRAAAQEVEAYQRVNILPIDEVDLTGHAVAELTHLLAELIENATSFSPPETVVQIGAKPTARGYVLEIEDRGIGMSDEELAEANERMSHPPAIDADAARMLGLHVVGRLAKRHGINVALRHSWYGGVTALVFLPAQLTIHHPTQQQPSQPTQHQPSQPTQHQPGQLPAPDRHAPGSPAPTAPPAERLPVFEQARADWFETSGPGEPRRGPRSPIGQRRPMPPPHPAAPPHLDDNPAAPQPTARPTPPVNTEPVDPRFPGPHPSPTATPPAAPRSNRPPVIPAERAVPRTPPRPGPPEPPTTPVPGMARQPSGLPRRTPNAKLAPGLAAGSAPPPASGPPTTGLSRSPEEIRAMLSSYRSGLERGRRMAAAPPPPNRYPLTGEPADNP